MVLGDSGGGGCLTFCFNRERRTRAAVFIPFVLLFFSGAAAQTPADSAAPATADPSNPTDPGTPSDASPGDPLTPSADASQDRILGVIPTYLTVENPNAKVVPLTVKEKFELFAKETIDPFTVISAAAGAALSQADNDNPRYGEGSGPYAERFGAAVADVTTQNFFSDAVLASAFHEDPRYFREGPEYGIWHRVGYALSRVVVTRTDSGNDTFNYAGVLGMSLGIGLSNAYYPDSSVSGKEVASRFGTSLVAASLSNLLPEFWPDVHDKFFHHKPHNQLKP